MIFYFSGTGNSQWIAEQVAAKIGDVAHNILKLKETPNLCKEQYIGFVFPIYAWGIPEPMLTFVKSLSKSAAFSFGICTCGADAGKALRKLSKLYFLDSSYSIIMPNNYVIGSELEDKDAILDKIASAKIEIQIISDDILKKKKVYRVSEGPLPALKSNVAHTAFNKFARNTKPFYVIGQCNGCGLCANDCPASTITLVNGKPNWNHQCFQCLRCINQCPCTAIQYGKATEARSRYSIKKYL